MENKDKIIEEVLRNHKNIIEHFEILKKFEDIKFVFLPKTEEEKIKNYHDSLIVILNQSFSLWFFYKDNTWKYDGWETGDYSEHNWKKNQLL